MPPVSTIRLGLVVLATSLILPEISSAQAGPLRQAPFKNGVEMKMIWLPAGGITASVLELGKGGWERQPKRRLVIRKPFYLSSTEVTQAQWSAVMNGNPSKERDDKKPVEEVSWDDAMEFCVALTARERAAGNIPVGVTYTLPTEDQWEYAARAGDDGDVAKMLDIVAWHAGNSGGRTHHVATKKANDWGFHDMQGNVWEWCLNDYRKRKAIRGGSYYPSSANCRIGCRRHEDHAVRNGNLGFRVALVAEDKGN